MLPRQMPDCVSQNPSDACQAEEVKPWATCILEVRELGGDGKETRSCEAGDRFGGEKAGNMVNSRHREYHCLVLAPTPGFLGMWFS